VVTLTQRILEKVPDKFLAGLSVINFYDDEKYPIVRYLKGKPFSKPSRIDVFMGGVASKQKYSLMHFNFVILQSQTMSFNIFSQNQRIRINKIIDANCYKL